GGRELVEDHVLILVRAGTRRLDRGEGGEGQVRRRRSRYEGQRRGGGAVFQHVPRLVGFAGQQARHEEVRTFPFLDGQRVGALPGGVGTSEAKLDVHQLAGGGISRKRLRAIESHERVGSLADGGARAGYASVHHIVDNGRLGIGGGKALLDRHLDLVV